MNLFEFWYLVSQYLIFVTGVIYAVVAYCQLRAISRQADIGQKTIEVLRQQRSPRVLLWDCSIGKDDNDRPVIQFNNVGPENAFLLASSFNVVTEKKLPDVPQYKEALRPTRTIAHVLPPDAKTPRIFLDLPANAPNLETVEALRLSGIHLFVYGFLDYGDSFKVRRRVGFAFQYDGAQAGGRFTIAGGDTYNYENIIEDKPD